MRGDWTFGVTGSRAGVSASGTDDEGTVSEERIVRHPRTVGGEAVFKGTRVTLRTVLASLAEGASSSEILADFPTLCEGDVRAAIAFAAASAQEDLPVSELPAL
ncbi:MAG: DUF433 domain-containing protein [Bryobacteraceae bacterium]